MSDQDFFFDEEDEKPARAEKAAPKSSSKSTGSKAPAKTTGTKTAPAKTGSAKSAPVQSEPSAEGFLFEPMTVGKGIAVLAVVCALLLGMALGVVVGQSRAQASLADVPAPTATTGGTGGQTAPQLTQDQINSGQLPAGHPSIGASGSAAATGK